MRGKWRYLPLVGTQRQPRRPWWQVTGSPWVSLTIGLGFLVSGSIGIFLGPLRFASVVWTVLGLTYLASSVATFRSGQAVRSQYPVRWVPFWPPDEDER